MAGFTDVLGSLMQGGLAKSSTNRMTNPFGAGGGGSLGDIVGRSWQDAWRWSSGYAGVCRFFRP